MEALLPSLSSCLLERASSPATGDHAREWISSSCPRRRCITSPFLLTSIKTIIPSLYLSQRDRAAVTQVFMHVSAGKVLFLTPQPLCSRCEGSRTGRRWYEAQGSSWPCLLCGSSDTPLHPSHRPKPPGCNQLETSGPRRRRSARKAKVPVRLMGECVSVV